MLFYRFNPDNGEFIRAEMAFIDPLESQRRGVEVFLVPANSVTTPPPEVIPSGFVAVWDNGQWNTVADFRGRDIWNAKGERNVITELGEVPEGWSLTPPILEATQHIKRYSKLKIIRTLGDEWSFYKKQLEDAELADEFWAANDLAEDDPAFIAFIQNVPDDLKAKLAECEV